MKSLPIPSGIFDGGKFQSAFGFSPEAENGQIVNVPDSYQGDLSEFALTAQEEDDRNEEAEVDRKMWRWRYLITKRANGISLTAQEQNWLNKAQAVLERKAGQ